MSTMHPTNDFDDKTHGSDNFDSISSRDQLLGMLGLVLILLTAILLRSI